jgi:DNA-binding transcriptional LysR family regulator
MKVKNKALIGQLSDTDLRLLQVYKAVVDCGGLSAAELELNIGVSTISRHVKDLETRLGLTLCQRGRSGFSITRDGQEVYRLIVDLLRAINDFRSGIDDIHQHMSGELHVALFEKTATNPNAQISHAVTAFVQQAADVSLHMHVRPINEIERGIMDGRFQVGIVAAHRPSASLQYDRLFSERMQLYCHADHPLVAREQTTLQWDDLRSFGLAGLAYHSPNMQMSHRTGLVRQAHAYDQEGVVTLILSGQFIGFLPTHYAQSFVTRGQICCLNPDLFFYEAEFFAITRRSPEPCRASNLFRNCLISAHQRTS